MFHSETVSSSDEYRHLKGLLKREGLFESQPVFYTAQISSSLSLLAIGVALLVVMDQFWIRLLDAAFLAFVTTQLGFIGHDAGHRQIFRRPKANDGVLLGLSPLIGLSGSWWRQTHNRHHAETNNLERDPHTAIPGLAFTREQLAAKNGILQRLVKLQFVYFFPLLLLEGPGARLASVQFLLTRKTRYLWAEAAALTFYLVGYMALLLLVMEPGQAALFAAVHLGLTGFYMGLVFAPNHKGMLIVESGSTIGFLRQQVGATRNMRPHFLTDYFFGGLNYQIEHHLFPNLPRNKLKQARPLVKTFCADRGIPYHEASILRSYGEVTAYLYKVVR